MWCRCRATNHLWMTFYHLNFVRFQTKLLVSPFRFQIIGIKCIEWKAVNGNGTTYRLRINSSSSGVWRWCMRYGGICNRLAGRNDGDVLSAHCCLLVVKWHYRRTVAGTKYRTVRIRIEYWLRINIARHTCPMIFSVSPLNVGHS